MTNISLFSQQFNYGLEQDSDNPSKITAVAYPDYTSANVTISSAVFSFLLPEGTTTSPAIPALPSSGNFVSVTGSWSAQVLTPSLYASVGLNPADLEGNDVYQVVLQNAPSPIAFAGQAIKLFSFELPADCIGGDVAVLTNNSSIQQAILNNLGANFNNQISASVNNAPSYDIYGGNSSAVVGCPLASQDAPAVTYGIVQDNNDNTRFTMVAYPDYSSANVTISSAVFSFLLPENTVTSPAIAPVPSSGSFQNETGSWTAQLLTPSLYASVGFNPADLEGNDVYQVVLQNAPSPITVAGQPVPLFSFRIPSGCFGGTAQVLINDSNIQQAILNNLGANFNNQMSMSVNDAPSTDIYSGNDAVSASVSCGSAANTNTGSGILGGLFGGSKWLTVKSYPNPFYESATVDFYLPEPGMVQMRVMDVNGKVLKQMEGDFSNGENQFRIQGADLPAGTYYYVLKTDKESVSGKLIRVE